jgi:predicted Zn-dependent protease
MAKEQLTQGLTGAVLVAAGSGGEARMAQMIGQMVNMQCNGELQSTGWACGSSQAGYDPRAMIGVQEILAAEAGGQAPPEILSTHPSAPNRIQTIEAAIAEVFPGGVPSGLQP